MNPANPENKSNIQHQQRSEETTSLRDNPDAVSQQPAESAKTSSAAHPPHNLLNESPKNRIASWQRLREMDISLAEKQLQNMPAADKEEEQP